MEINRQKAAELLQQKRDAVKKAKEESKQRMQSLFDKDASNGNKVIKQKTKTKVAVMKVEEQKKAPLLHPNIVVVQ